MARYPTRPSEIDLRHGAWGMGRHSCHNVGQEAHPGASPVMDVLCIRTLRTLAISAIRKANSGHPGTPIGLPPTGYVLWNSIVA